MQKGLFIGLGGAGVKTAARLKALLFQRNYGSSKAAMDSECSFIFYDTDWYGINCVQEDAKLRKMLAPYPMIDMQSECVFAGEVSPYTMFCSAINAPLDDADSQRLLEWAIDPHVQGHFSLKSSTLREGVGHERMAGRMGFVYGREMFEQLVLNALQRPREADEPGAWTPPVIWVISSCLGGTGSSALLDVLYLIDRWYKLNVDNADPDVRLVLYMPKTYIDMNHGVAFQYALNSYSALWELNEFRIDAVLRNDGMKFGTFAVQTDRLEWKAIQTPWRVCSWVFGVDAESQEGSRISSDQMYDNTAELCFFMHASAIGQNISAHLDAAMPGYYNQYSVDHSDESRWSQFVVGSGCRSIVKADEFLKEYVRRRFRYDLYGYGLIGLDFEKILHNEECRLKAAKAFATSYIMEHLINIDRFDFSAKNSLYGIYEREFGVIMLPSDGEVPSKDDYFNMGEMFVTGCKVIAHRLASAFDDPSSPYSKTSWLSKIEQSVKEGLEKCIVDFGLNYAYSLISFVNEGYLKYEVLGRLRPKDNLRSLERKIEDIIQIYRRPFSRRKGIVELVATMNEYKKACIEELTINHIRTIIHDLTCEKTGFLHYLCEGNQTHVGIAGLIRTAYDSFNASKASFQDLALYFTKTSSDVCTDYFPHVFEFVENGEMWKKANLFEQLYSSIVPVDSYENAEAFERSSLGCPPFRNKGERGLSPIISEIKNKIPNYNCFFSEMALCHPVMQFHDMFKELTEQTELFIEQAMNDNAYDVKPWLDSPLQRVFNECFVKDGVVDRIAQQEYIDRFMRSTSVFYPTPMGAMLQPTMWMWSVGDSLWSINNGNVQFFPDPSLGHRWVLVKLEVGYSFKDYKYFDMLNRIYEKHREQIEQEAIGCYIHKEFVHRDIGQAFNQVRSK